MKILRCDECEVWISIKLDRQPLPGGVGSVEIFEAHLAACAPCRRLLAEEAMRSAFLREELCGARDPLTPLAAAILEESSRPNGARSCRSSVPRRAPAPGGFPAALAAVAAVLVVAAGLLVGNSGGKKTPTCAEPTPRSSV
jgi:anti-sigma factor RsiW